MTTKWFQRSALVFTIGSIGCSDGVSDDPGLSARMRIQGAQFIAGPLPTTHGSPEVTSIDLLTNNFWPGDSNKPLRGTMGISATAAALALSDDAGFWIVPAGVPDVSAPELPTFRAIAAFSSALAPGAYTLQVHAVDAAGNFGPPNRRMLTALATSPSRTAQGELVVTLTWDTQADVDLHVVDPLGNEIYHGATSSRNAFAPGGAASTSGYGILDVDSNASCSIDGFRREDVTWAAQPPVGHYLVRVDTASLCDTTLAHWTVEVTLQGATVARAAGTAFDPDTWESHDRGAGVLAVGFDVP